MNRFSTILLAIMTVFFFNACASGGGVFDAAEDDTPNVTNNVTNVVSTPATPTPTDVPAEVTKTTVYGDLDGDGYSPAKGNDCDETNANINKFAKEVCDGIDNNCDGHADEGLTEEVYFDGDKDGYGLSKEVTSVCIGVTPPKGYTTKAGDCNDSALDKNADGKVDGFWIHKDATETCDDGIDNNCDSQTDEGCAPESTDLKTGDNFAIAVIWPSDKVGQKIMAVEYYTEHDVDIGAEWTLKEASATSNVMIIVPDGNACGVRFQTAYADKEWLVSQIDDKGTVELNKSATILLIKADGSITDITSIVTTWKAPEGGGSALLKLHDCK